MYDAEGYSLYPAQHLVTDSTSPTRELQPIYEIEENPGFPPSPAAPNFAPASVYSALDVTLVSHLAQSSVRPELSRKGPSLPQSSGEMYHYQI